MILVHLSDLHLGHRGFAGTREGREARDRDVEAAFQRALEAVVGVAPDVVVLSGDLFDNPEPPAASSLALVRGLGALRESLPRAPILAVAGPRDTPTDPRSPGPMSILGTIPGVYVATDEARSVFLADLSLHAVLLPHRALVGPQPTVPEPDGRARWKVLVAHASLRDGLGPWVDPSRWSYVALGHEHTHRIVAPRVAFAGSLERVGVDPWVEAAEDKGFLTVDLVRGRSELKVVPGRAVVDLAPIRMAAADPESVARKVREVTNEVPGGIDGKIVRLTLEGAIRGDLASLPPRLLASLRERSLHLCVELTGDADHSVPGPNDLASRLRARLSRKGLEPGLARRWTERLFDESAVEGVP